MQKESYLFVIITLLLFFSCGNSNTGHRIEIKFPDHPGKKIILGRYYSDQPYPVDTAYLENGMFLFSGDSLLEEGVYCILPDGSPFFDFIVGKNQHIEISAPGNNLKENVEFSNSTENDVFLEFVKIRPGITTRVAALQQDLAMLNTQPEEKSNILKRIDLEYSPIRLLAKKLDPKENDFTFKVLNGYCPPLVPENISSLSDSVFRHYHIKNHFFDYMELSDPRMIKTPFFNAKFKQYLDLFCNPEPDSLIKEADNILSISSQNDKMHSYMATSLLSYFKNTKTFGKDRVFSHIASEYFIPNKIPFINTKTSERIRFDYEKVRYNLIGNVAPDFTLSDLRGNQYKLSQESSPVTLLYFWDPKCENCQETLPEFKALYSKYQSRGLRMLSICVNTEESSWRDYLKTTSVPGKHLYNPKDDMQLKTLFNIYGTPITYLIDEKGVIIGKRLVAKQIDQKLEYILQ